MTGVPPEQVADLLSGDEAVVLAPPETGVSTALDELVGDRERVVRTPAGLPSEPPERVVIDGWYVFLTQYVALPEDDREQTSERLSRIVSESVVQFHTTPYRLEWLFDTHRETVESLFGSIDGLSASFLAVSRADAEGTITEAFRAGELSEPGYNAALDRLDELTYTFDVATRFESVLSNEERTAVFGDVETYETYVPSIPTEMDDPESFFERRKATLAEFGEAFALSEFVTDTKGVVESVTDGGVLNTLSVIRESGLDALGDLGRGAITSTAEVAPFVEPAVGSAVSLIAWGYLRHRQQDDTRGQIREEFGDFLTGGGVTTPADREQIEMAMSVEPMTLSALEELTSPTRWVEIRGALDRLATVESTVAGHGSRLAELEAVAEDHRVVLENLQYRLREARTVTEPDPYESVEEFAGELFSQQEYVQVRADYETDDFTTRSATLPVEPNDGVVPDARQAVVRLLADGVRTVRVHGEGGIGKSQLLASVARELPDEYDTQFVTEPVREVPPEIDGDTVLFVDDAGRKEMDYFLRLAEPRNRPEETREYDLQVVVAARSVYADAVEARTDEVGGRSPKLTLRPLTEERAREIFGRFGIEDERAGEFHDVAGGNPFFTVLLGEAAGEGEEDPPDIKSSFRRVVRDMVDTDLQQVGESVEDVRSLLDVTAAMGTYEEPADKAALAYFADVFETDGKRHDRLAALVSEGYLTGSTEPWNGGSYSIRYDPVADYLLFRVLQDDANGYERYVREVLEQKASDVAGVLVGLTNSPLLRLYPEQVEAIAEQISWLSERVFELDVPTAELFRTQAVLSLPAPGVVDHELLAEEFDTGAELVGPIASLTERYSRLVERDEDLIEVTNQYYGWLDDLEAETDTAVEPLASVSVNVINRYGEVGSLEEMERKLQRLEQLHDTHPDQPVRTELAKGLFNATKAYGEAGELEEIEATITRMHRVSTEWGDLGGITQKHPDALESLTLDLLTDSPPLAATFLEAIRPDADRTTWTTLTGDVFKKVDELFAAGDLSIDTYDRFDDLRV